MSHPFFAGRSVPKFEAIQHCLVPRSQSFTAEQKMRSLLAVNDLLAAKPASMRIKLKIFLAFIDFVSICRGGLPFTYLNRTRQKQIMTFFFDSPVRLLRQGFWGLNTLIKLGVFGQPSVYGEIGYSKKELPS